MSTRTIDPISQLYAADETAWLEAMAEAAHQGRVESLDLSHLAEYLSDMARRDRREVRSRLVVLMTHVLKWSYQPELRTRGWLASVVEQRQELNQIAGGGVLRTHAVAVLSEAYNEAVERAMAETGLALDTFPPSCPYSLTELLAIELEPSAE